LDFGLLITASIFKYYVNLSVPVGFLTTTFEFSSYSEAELPDLR